MRMRPLVTTVTLAMAALASVAHAQNYTASGTSSGSYTINADFNNPVPHDWNINLTISGTDVTVNELSGNLATRHQINPLATLDIDVDYNTQGHTLPLELQNNSSTLFSVRSVPYDTMDFTGTMTTPYSQQTRSLQEVGNSSFFTLDFANYPDSIEFSQRLRTPTGARWIATGQNLQGFQSDFSTTLFLPSSTTANVPEPRTAILAIASVASLLAVRRGQAVRIRLAVIALVMLPATAQAQRFTGTRDGFLSFRVNNESFGGFGDPMDVPFPVNWTADVEIRADNSMVIHEISVTADPVILTISPISSVQIDSFNATWDNITKEFFPDAAEEIGLFRTSAGVQPTEGEIAGTSTLLGNTEPFLFDVAAMNLPVSSNRPFATWFDLDNYGSSINWRGWSNFQSGYYSFGSPGDIGNGLSLTNVAAGRVRDFSFTGADVNRFDLTRPLQGDFNGDGESNGADFLQWQTDPSQGSLEDWELEHPGFSPPPTIQSVPEPTTAMLTFIGMSLVSMRRRAVR